MQTAMKEKVLKAIGNNIQKIRKEKGKERKEIADLLGLSPQGYGNIENGKTDLSICHAIDLAAILQTNYQQILNVENATAYNYSATNNSGGNNILKRRYFNYRRQQKTNSTVRKRKPTPANRYGKTLGR